MPLYPTTPAKAKHDLCRVKQELPLLSSLEEMKEFFKHSHSPDLVKIASVYSYSDAPEPPLSRTLVVAAYIQLKEEEEWEFPVPCTLAVAAPPFATPQHETNAHQFRQFLTQSKYPLALLLPDKYQRWGLLRLTDDASSNNDSVVSLHVLTSWSQLETKTVKEEATTTTTTTTELWHPPTPDMEYDAYNTTTSNLWQPPTENDSPEHEAFPTTTATTVANSRKRPLEEHKQETNGTINSYKRPTIQPSRQPPLDTITETTANQRTRDAFHQDASAAAADEFYSNLDRTLEFRWQSQIYHMRNYNGWVKAMQIQHFYATFGNKAARILDLACGKGGDLTKWTLGKIQNYVGMDVARGSLQDAAKRARNLRQQLPRCTFSCADLGANVPGRYKQTRKGPQLESLLTWSLHQEASSSSEPVFTWQKGGGIGLDDSFDVVSIQFAIHYMMSSEKRAKRFFRTVSQLLTKGGKLLITTMDARVVVEHLMQTGCDFHAIRDEDDPVAIRLGGGLCQIQFAAPILRRLFATDHESEECNNANIIKNWFGLEYSFTLLDGNGNDAKADAVNLPEWLSPLPALEALAESVGLELESVHNFHEFYQQNHEKSSCQSSLYTMNVLNRHGSISATEWEISRLYCAMQFVKVKDYVDNAIDEDDDDNDEKQDGVHPREEQDAVNDYLDDIDTQLKAKLFPMALMKAKKGFDGDWNHLDSDEKTRLTNAELRKLAKSS
ncbi:mRNA (guanine-N7-)-methyltransferase [Fistulifera solaris]|uniref:mRNA (guanine-N(7))-methyltransferase n=1 Tax=Fistulifera solaris TaxID=1519565 RepID=A0A1Z5K6B1_FISSO|nr:mRNA (guanine-N7-)-methyltransferase [Fistulifera solaris]|eukprot:GAX21735.1 mRNA (guanine-N7-)-methyltransferase [Fistulifera solaris]